LAGAADQVLPDRSIAGVDQTSFFLADDGQSERENAYFWMGSTFAAMWMRGYKMNQKVVMPAEKSMWIDTSPVQSVGSAPWLFNLYIDPKEEITIDHRLNAWLAAMHAEMRHMARPSQSSRRRRWDLIYVLLPSTSAHST
jgi:arylsulfatase